MKHITFDLETKASVTLNSLVHRKANTFAPTPVMRATGFAGADPTRIHETDLTSVLVEADDPNAVSATLGSANESAEHMADGFVSARISTDTVGRLLQRADVTRMQAKKKSKPRLELASADVGLRQQPAAARSVVETGQNVLIGIVDTGFDLSHPMFKDAAGNLRVAGLLDQTRGNREFTAAQLAGAAESATDPNGHGTHVATIAGGSAFHGREGVAPGAKYLLVKTDFENTDEAVSWIFKKAGATPCVVNMSLGHHFGAHDGTDAEERLHKALAAPGRVIVVAAGNERTDRIHFGGTLDPGESHQVKFDVLRPEEGMPTAVITLWYSEDDQFDVSIVAPTGDVLDVPALGKSTVFQFSRLDVEVSRRRYSWSNSVQVQIGLGFKTKAVRDRDIFGWAIRMTCKAATVGRIDAWMNNSGYASFHDHPLLEMRRTLGLPSTGDGCITVASHISKNEWAAHDGPQVDGRLVRGRSSAFSSRGPTRDGRWKPEVSAPGQYITAALADLSEMADWNERANQDERILTIEGTSMACPMVTGAVALMLQKNPALTTQQVRDVLEKFLRKDAHTGVARWSSTYGFGKLSLPTLLANV